ncbi:MAG: hypothetical protein ABIA93_01805 [Candidatus Woesearchaeota archaeon]
MAPDELHNFLMASLQDTLQNNLLALIVFGSGNNGDYLPQISDVDYFAILETIDSSVLNKIETSKRKVAETHSVKLDIKPITINEVRCELQRDHGTGFFNGWAIHALKNGYQKIVYDRCHLADSISNTNIPLHTHCDERLAYYVHKLRKAIQGESFIFHNTIKRLTKEEQYKVAVSSIKNILTFSNALQGKFVYTNDQVLRIIADEKLRAAVSKVFENKRTCNYDLNDLLAAYNLIEKYNMLQVETYQNNKQVPNKMLQEQNHEYQSHH